jgi:ABC-type dipeptide/oligopeptide/nickel transport system permease component
MHLSPGDPARIMLGIEASHEDIEALRKALGLDQPLYVQYFRWLRKVVEGDFGRSIQSRQPVLEMILDRLPATLELTTAAMVLSLLIALPAGVISAIKQYSIFDHSSMVGALFWVSMPGFWLGLMLMLLFGLYLGWLPISGRGGIEHLILPSVTLGAPQAALIARLTRSSMLEVIRQDYIQTARAKGLKERIIILKHALKNAMIPITTIVALRVPMLFGGAVVTETIFAWPGMGRLIVSSIFERDFPVVQGTTLILAMIVILANLLADIMYAYMDPRIKYG